VLSSHVREISCNTGPLQRLLHPPFSPGMSIIMVVLLVVKLVRNSVGKYRPLMTGDDTGMNVCFGVV
jgi:hypothetical protein